MKCPCEALYKLSVKDELPILNLRLDGTRGVIPEADRAVYIFALLSDIDYINQEKLK